MKVHLKGHSNEIFLPPICSQMDSFQAPYSVFKDFLNLVLNLRRYSRFFIHSPLLFIAESPYSPYCYYGELQLSVSLYQELLFVRIICINSQLSFNTESLYSPYCLLRRVTTLCIIYSGESLLTAESYFQKLWRTLPSFQGTMKQKINHTWVEHYPPRTL